jgi:hypothetical protein
MVLGVLEMEPVFRHFHLVPELLQLGYSHIDWASSPASMIEEVLSKSQ